MRLGSSALSWRSAGVALLAATGLAGRASALAPNLRIESNTPGAHFGESMASAGDVNGDGIEDLVVGAPYYSDGEYNEGAVFLFLGRPEGLVTSGVEQADAVIESNQGTQVAGARFGTAVAAGVPSGDKNTETRITGAIENGGSAGTVKLQWAQSTAGASGTIVRRGSFLRAQKLP